MRPPAPFSLDRLRREAELRHRDRDRLRLGDVDRGRRAAAGGDSKRERARSRTVSRAAEVRAGALETTAANAWWGPRGVEGHRGGILPYSPRPHDAPSEVDHSRSRRVGGPPSRSPPVATRRSRSPRAIRLSIAPRSSSRSVALAATPSTRSGTHGSASNIRTREHIDGPNFNVRHECRSASCTRSRTAASPRAIMPANIIVGEDTRLAAQFVAKYAGSQAGDRPEGTGDAANGYPARRSEATPAATRPPRTIPATTPAATSRRTCRGRARPRD